MTGSAVDELILPTQRRRSLRARERPAPADGVPTLSAIKLTFGPSISDGRVAAMGGADALR